MLIRKPKIIEAKKNRRGHWRVTIERNGKRTQMFSDIGIIWWTNDGVTAHVDLCSFLEDVIVNTPAQKRMAEEWEDL